MASIEGPDDQPPPGGGERPGLAARLVGARLVLAAAVLVLALAVALFAVPALDALTGHGEAE